MKKFYFLISLLVLSFTQVAAGPIRGAWISYQAIDTNSYTLRVHVIRDCSASGLTTPSLKISWSQGHINVPTTLESSRDVSGINAACADTSICNGGTLLAYGYQLQTYQAIWDLDTFGSACDFTISYSDTAQRVSTNGNGEAFYVFSKLNRCLYSIENSLELVEIVPFLNHVNSSFSGGYPVADSNGVMDSISYELTSALKDSNTSITYNTSFSASVPFMSIGFPLTSLNIENPTGNLRFNGAIGGQHEVMALRIKGWKRISGVMALVSEQHVDHDVIIGNLQNFPPKMTGPTNLLACAVQPNCWRFSAQELDTGQSIVPFVLDSLPGMTWYLVDSSSTDPVLEVCWTPDTSLVRSEPYLFRVGFIDDHCPYKGYSFQTVAVEVTDPVDSSFIPELQINRVCGGYQLVVVDSLNRGIPYTWIWGGKTLLSDTLDIINTVGWQVFQYGYRLGACELYLTDSIYLERDSIMTVQFNGNSLATCPNVERFVSASIVSGGRAPFNYLWFDSTSLDSVAIISDTTQKWRLQVTDSVGCVISDSIRVPILPQFSFISDSLRLCSQKLTGPFDLKVRVTKGDSALLNFYWDGFGEGNGYQATIPFSQQHIPVEVRDVYSCSQYDTLYISRYTAQKPNAGPDIANCGGNSIQLHAIDSLPSTGTYEWIGYGLGKQITAQVGTSASIVLKYTDLYGCPTYDTTETRIYEVPDPHLGDDTAICMDELVVLRSNHSKGVEPFNFVWNFGAASGDSTTFKVGGSVLVYLRLEDSAGCIGRDTILIQVKSKPNLVMTDPPERCQAAGPYNLFPYGSPQGGVWRGPSVSNSTFNPTMLAGGTYTLLYSYTNMNGCTSTDSVHAKVEALVNVNFSATPISGRSPLNVNFQNLSSGGVQNSYEWDFGDSTATSTAVNPSHIYTKSGVYSVKLKITGNLCVSELIKNKYVYVDTFGVGIEDFQAIQVKAYPNPTKSVVYLESIDASEIASIEVYSITGQAMSQVNIVQGDAQWKVDLSELAAANYHLHVTMKSGERGVIRVNKE
ncbi:MAG: PKD domain-containing protein [Bacteroidetes bacterium]|nr:MAG: PKD domain-containing protein [Bacteroidota bacterium]